jgi:hypothetical protein
MMLAKTEHFINSAAQILKISQEDLILRNYSGLQQIWNKTDKNTWIFSEKNRSFLNPL